MSTGITDLTPYVGPEAVRQTALDRLGVLDTGPAERFDRIARLAAEVLGVAMVRINLVDRDRVWSKAQTDAGPSEFARDEVPCGTAVDTPGITVIADLAADESTKHLPAVVHGGLRFYAGHPVQGPGGAAVGMLCVLDTETREFTPAQEVILQDLAGWVSDELNLAHEMQRSHAIQMGLLPRKLMSLDGYDIAGVCAPITAVGGDFYDWYPVRGGAAITLADVMGKGVPAAIIAATVRAVMRAGSRVAGVAAAVESAAEALDADLEGCATFVTLFHAHLNELTGEVRYIDAGHGLTLVVHADGTSERLSTGGLPLGAGWDTTWDERSVVLAAGDTLVSVSDGVLDAFDGTLASLDEVERIARSAPDADTVVADLLARVRGTAPDDVTIVALRREF